MAGLAMLLGAAAAAAPADDVYRALADNDAARAQTLSAAWLQHDANDAAARIARLDVCEAAHRLDACAADAAPGSDDAARAAIAHALAARDGTAALRLAQQWVVDAKDAAARTEAQYYLALAAYQRSEHATVLRAAAVALKQLASTPGPRARWREALLASTASKAHYSLGQFAQAREAAAHTHAIAAAAFGASSELALRSAIAQAGAAHAFGRFDEERDVLDAALAEARASRPESALRVLLEGAYGSYLNLTGDYAAARAHYDTGAALLARGVAIDAGDAMRFENGFGMLLLNTHEERAALDAFTRALAAFPDDAAYAITNAIVARNKAEAELKLQQYADAAADYARSIDYRARGGDRDSAGVALSYHGLGAVALAQGQFADAEKHFRRALELTRHGWSEGHPEIAVLQFGLALARWGQDDDSDAFAQACAAAELQHAQLLRFVGAADEAASVRYRELMVPATALAVTLAARRGDAASIAAAWQLAMRERALVADHVARRFAAAHAVRSTALRAAWDAWRAADAALASAWLRPDAGSAEMARREDAAQRAERRFWRLSGLNQTVAATPLPTLDQLRRALPPHGRLFAVAEGLAPQPARLLLAAHGAVEEPEDWYAFVLTPDAAPRLLRLGAIDALSGDVRAWYAAARDPHIEARALAQLGSTLRAQLFDASATLDEPGTVFFVPEGELFRLNPAALPAPQGFVVEAGVDVQILAHEHDLLLPAPAPVSGRAVLAGAPQFAGPPAARAPNAPACALAQSEGFAAIPQAARELGEVRTLLAASLDRRVPIELIEGDQATVERVSAALAGASVVHLATHGFSLDETCAAQARGVRGVSVARAPAAPPAAALSGLAFAHASLDRDGDAFGILSAQNLMFLDLSHAAWVVLSACDSGLGPIRRGEGVFGMRRALRFAGANTVIMSLWEIDDAATAEWMSGLYRARFRDHASVPHAIGEATRGFLAARRAAGLPDQPYYWAAFIGEGGWR